MINEEKKQRLDKGFEEFIDVANSLARDIGNAQLAFQCMALAYARYGTWFLTEGGSFDMTSLEAIAQKSVAGLSEGMLETIDNLTPPEPAHPLSDFKKSPVADAVNQAHE